MATEINKNRRCVLIAGAPGADAALIRAALKPDDYIICADRGYKTAVEADITADAEQTFSFSQDIKDPKLWSAETPNLYDLVLTDHTLANLSVTEYLADRGSRCIILSENEKAELLTVGAYTYSGCKGLTFSVFPYGCQKAVLSYKGAYYPLEHGVLTHSTAMGVSNIFTADKAEITVHEGKALLIINTRKDS